MPVLVTGSAGFIGYHVAEALLARGEAVVGVDNLNPYYDVALKEARLARLEAKSGFSFLRCDIADGEALAAALAPHPAIRRVVHLAAQAGVRHSLTHPFAYLSANLTGHLVMLELCRRLPDFEHLVYASSSSVYGGNRKLPFAVADRVDQPISLYAATKKADELMSHSYSHLYRSPQTGLRYFTVYGPWGRPDMALYIFTRALLAGEPITLFNHGDMNRDFTYVDDVVAGTLAALDRPPAARTRRLPIASTTWATTAASPCCGWSRCWSGPPASRPRSSSSRCSRATSRIPTPTSPGRKPTSASRRPSPSTRACPASSTGTEAIMGFER